MSLILEDGTGRPDSNAYASVAESDAFHADRLYATAWTGASSPDKARALVMATRVLDAGYEWAGFRQSTEQRLDWPRVKAPRRDLYTVGGFGVVGNFWPESGIPRILKDATCEMARELLTTDRTADDAAKGIKKIGLGQGALDIEFDPSDRKLPVTDEIMRILAPIGSPRGQRSQVRVIRV